MRTILSGVVGFLVGLAIGVFTSPRPRVVQQPQATSCAPTCLCQCNTHGCGCHDPRGPFIPLRDYPKEGLSRYSYVLDPLSGNLLHITSNPDNGPKGSRFYRS